ncbi:MAG: ABC transporter substrate-binding protein [Anaerolineae bacterium]|nr:ABC transporter substrate-binding protein [Anaerolineae bacterium]
MTPDYKRLLILAVLVWLYVGIGGCSSGMPKNSQAESEEVAVDVVLINPIGPAVIPVAGIAGGTVKGKIDINIQYWKTVDEAVGLLSGDNVEFAVLPVTTGVNLHASGIDIVLLAVHEWKVFYLVAANTDDFDGWHDVIGKTIYTPEAKGQTVDVLTRYALIREGIIPDDEVAFAYLPAQEIVALFKEGKIELAALPEPFVTQALASGKGTIGLDYQEYWSEVSGARDGIPIAGLFVKQDFYNSHPDVVRAVTQTFAESTQWANDHPEAAIRACTEVLPLPSEVLMEALPRILFKYISAPDAREDILDFLSAMRETDPEGIKQIPGDEFFKQ